MGGWEALRLVMFSGMTCKTKSKCIPAGLFAVLAAIIFLFFATCLWSSKSSSKDLGRLSDRTGDAGLALMASD